VDTQASAPPGPDQRGRRYAQGGPLAQAQRAIYKGQLICGVIGLSAGLLGLAAHWLAPSQAALASSANVSPRTSGYALMATAGLLLTVSAWKRIRSLQARERAGQPPAA
jgi:hypothetical protein